MTTSKKELVDRGTFDRVDVIDENGEEVTVFNWLTVQTVAQVRGDNPVFEQFDDAARIGAGDSWMPPEAVTKNVAEELQSARGIDVRDHDIRVIDPSDDEVTIV